MDRLRKRDAEHYNYFRDYDPAIGRYIESDPIKLAGGLNTFVYVFSNPLRWRDAFGLHTEVIAWDPVGAGGSSFGHMSVNQNGTNFSFGTGGWDSNSDASSAANKNMTFRSGEGVVLNLSEDQEERFRACLAGKRGKYSFLNNNCTTPIELCLKEVIGLDSKGAASPLQMLFMIKNWPGLANEFTHYPRNYP